MKLLNSRYTTNDRIALGFGLWLIVGGMIAAWPQAEELQPPSIEEQVSFELDQLFDPPSETIEAPRPCTPIEIQLEQPCGILVARVTNILYGLATGRFIDGEKYPMDYANCGKVRNYRAHYRRGEPICERCRLAYAEYRWRRRMQGKK